MAKKAGQNPVQEAARAVFRRNRDLIRSSSRSKDILDRYDMEEPAYSRRKRAVVNLYSEVIERFAEKYPNSDGEKSVAYASSLPTSTYGSLNEDTQRWDAVVWCCKTLVFRTVRPLATVFC